MQNYSFRNKDLPVSRELRSALTHIHGVGLAKAAIITGRLGFGYPYSSKKLNSYTFSLITGFLNRLLISEVKARRVAQLHIKALKDTGSYKGKRHSQFLPCRGQRTRTNAKTQKRLKLKLK